MDGHLLTPDEIAVWICPVDPLGGALAAMDAVLSGEERARRDRFLLADDRCAFTAAHALLRITLSRYGTLPPSEWRFDTTPHGKPFITPSQAGDPALAFNLSHTRAVVACAVAVGTRVGVDVEDCGRVVNSQEIVSGYFMPSELQLLADCPRAEVDARFVELWTLKEAYIKAVGVGLAMPLDAFGFSFRGASELTFTCPTEQTAWQFWLAALSDKTRLAVAAPLERPERPWRISYHLVGGHYAGRRITPLRSTA